MNMFEVTDIQKIGVGLAGFGIFFLFLGVLLIFDKSLLALGNILFISGLACVIGRERTFRFFFQRHKAKGSLAFFGGITIVLIGWPIVGMLVETYGFVLLFRLEDLEPEEVLPTDIEPTDIKEASDEDNVLIEVLVEPDEDEEEGKETYRPSKS